jgi:EAL domain-containing protein (putative c-di-GMP-specific phosphodiesterase class I)
MEALIRWNNSELGAVPPNEFIPVAETTGLILPIGEWVLRTACAQLKAWQQEGSPELRMAVNVSAVQFTHPEFPAQVARVLEETGVDPTCLELEVTESVIMEDESGAAGTLAKLKQLGVSLSIDDFGTGYSNLARLREFPVDRLKVDRSFVRQISTRSNDRTITDAILAMARKLQIDVVAEGVEDFSQLLHLQEQQCDFAQGFLLSRPMPSNEARQFLQRLSQNREVTRTARLKSLMQ